MDVQYQRVTLQTEGACLCQPLSWSIAGMLGNAAAVVVVVVVVVRTRPRARPLALITMRKSIDPLHDPVTWYGINYAGTQVTQWDFQNKGTRTSPARVFFVLKVSLCNLHPSIIYSVPCDRIVQRVY